MQEYLEAMVGVCREIRRVLKPSGTFWLNIGSCYSGSGKGGNPANSPHQKQATNVGRLSVCGDRNSIQSRQRRRVQPYDSDGIERKDLLATDSVYRDHDDVSLNGYQTRHGRNSGTRRPFEQFCERESMTDRDNALLDSELRAELSRLSPKALSFFGCDPGAFGLGDVASASPQPPQKYSFDEIQKTGRAFDKKQPLRKSTFRTSDNGVLERACYCGSCGLCFVYLATSALHIKPKDLLLIPDLLALALQADGWFVRSEIVWHKPNPMPESVTDRPTCAHEKVWMLTKSSKYFYDADAVREPPSEAMLRQVADGYNGAATKDFETNGAQDASATKTRIIAKARARIDKHRSHGRRHDGFNDRWNLLTKAEQMACGANLRNVWSIPPKPYHGRHFATMPPALAERCIKAGCPVGGTVLDPFGGAGTTGLVAVRVGRRATLIDLKREYLDLAMRRISEDAPLLCQEMEQQVTRQESLL
jgi:DNA modification methylase